MDTTTRRSDALAASAHDAAVAAGPAATWSALDACDVGQVAGSPCPVCDAPLAQEHAHTRCRSCGWLGKCCE